MAARRSPAGTQRCLTTNDFDERWWWGVGARTNLTTHVATHPLRRPGDHAVAWSGGSNSRDRRQDPRTRRRAWPIAGCSSSGARGGGCSVADRTSGNWYGRTRTGPDLSPVRGGGRELIRSDVLRLQAVYLHGLGRTWADGAGCDRTQLPIKPTLEYSRLRPRTTDQKVRGSSPFGRARSEGPDLRKRGSGFLLFRPLWTCGCSVAARPTSIP